MSQNQTEPTQQQRKDQFIQYLDSNKFIEQLNSIFLQIYNNDEKPQAPMEFLLKQLQGPNEVDVEQLQKNVSDIKTENEELQTKIVNLKSEVNDLKTTLGYY